MSRVNTWKSSKEIFTTLVLKEAGPKLGRERLVAGVLSKYEAAILSGLKTMDEIDVSFTKAYNEKADVVPLTKLADTFAVAKTESAKQIKELVTKLDLGIARFKTEEAPGNPKMKENLVRGLKVLKTAVDAISKTADTDLRVMRGQIESKTKRLDSYEVLAQNFVVSLRGAVARGLAAAQRIKANPTPQVYNKEFPAAARDINAQLVAVPKMLKEGHKLPGPPDPSALMAALRPFASGDLLKIDLTKTPAEVLDLASRLNKAVKAVKDAYKV